MENVVQPDKQIAGSNPNACFSPANSLSPAVSAGKSPVKTEEEEEDAFYLKLNKLHESSGLSLLFNFRETRMDLYLFYTKVTEKGGFHQVSRDGHWEDVAFGLNIKGGVPITITPTQLQQLYASILYQFEQTYYYRTPAKQNKAPMRTALQIGHSSDDGDGSICSLGKRKHCDNPYPLASYFSSSGNPVKKEEYDQDSRKSSPVTRAEEKKPVLDTPPKLKEVTKDPRAPLGARNCYQIFFKIECDRLKRIYGDKPPGQLRDMAIEAWRRLSDVDKQPYIDASKKDKERYIREMAAYREQERKQQIEIQITSSSSSTSQRVINFPSPKLINFTRTPSRQEGLEYHAISHPDAAGKKPQNVNEYQNLSSSTNGKVIDFAKPSSMQTDGDYHVTLHPDDTNEILQMSDESMVEIAVRMMKNARPNDPIFQMIWDEYCGSPS